MFGKFFFFIYDIKEEEIIKEDIKKKLSMNDAIKEAQKTLPDYLEYYTSAPSNTFNHRVKALFSDYYGDEHIWITDFTVDLENNTINGILGNQPQIVKYVQGGQPVEVPLGKITDWGFQSGERQYGNYTVYIMFDYIHPDEVVMYKSQYGFDANPLENPEISFSEIISDIPVVDDDSEDTNDDADTDMDVIEDSDSFELEVTYRLEKHLEEEEEELDEA